MNVSIKLSLIQLIIINNKVIQLLIKYTSE